MEGEVSQLILDAVTQLRTDMAQQIASLSSRLDRLVSTEAHAADMRRVDQMHKDNQEDIRNLTAAQARQGEQMFNLFAQAQAQVQAEADARRAAEKNATDRRQTLERQVESDRRTERWRILGAVTALMAVAVSVMAIFVR